MTDSTVCPVTMCPYLGNEETGSPWTNEKNGDCEPDCGWWIDGSCLGGSELLGELMAEYDVDPEDEWPACPHEDTCQWQVQADPLPCPPRVKVMANVELSEAFL